MKLIRFPKNSLLSSLGLWEMWETPAVVVPAFSKSCGKGAGFIVAFPHDGSFHSPVLCSCGATRLGAGCEQLTVCVVAAEQIEAVVDSDRSVEVFANEHPTLGHTEAEGLSLDLKLDLAEGHDVVVADHAVVMFGEHLVEVCAGVRDERCPGLGCGDRELLVVLAQVSGQKAICVADGADACSTELLR